MSSPEHRLALSPKAEQDIENILCHTGETWGQAQLLAFRTTSPNVLATIRDNPAIGHTSDQLPETHRLFLVGSHVIVYRLRPQVIWIVRILHQRMSLGGRVELDRQCN